MLTDGLALQRRPSLDRHAVANLVCKIRIGRGQGGHATDAHGRRTWASLSDAPSRTSAFEHMMQFDIVTCRVEVRVSIRVGSARNATLGRSWRQSAAIMDTQSAISQYWGVALSRMVTWSISTQLVMRTPEPILQCGPTADRLIDDLAPTCH